jgi:hypothetical protein
MCLQGMEAEQLHGCARWREEQEVSWWYDSRDMLLVADVILPSLVCNGASHVYSSEESIVMQ